MEDQPRLPDDEEPILPEVDNGEFKLDHQLDNQTEQQRRIEQWQFRKSWNQFFEDLTAFEDERLPIEQLRPEQINLEDMDKSLKWSSDKLINPDAADPSEKVYELRQEVKDAATTSPGASSVGKIMQEALTQRQSNQPSQLATSQSLHQAAHNQALPKTKQSLYRQAVLIGFTGGVLVLMLITIINLVRS